MVSVMKKYMFWGILTLAFLPFLNACNDEDSGIKVDDIVTQRYLIEKYDGSIRVFANLYYNSGQTLIYSLPSGAWVAANGMRLTALPSTDDYRFGNILEGLPSTVSFEFHKNPSQTFTNSVDISDMPQVKTSLDPTNPIIANGQTYEYTLSGPDGSTPQLLLYPISGVSSITYSAYVKDNTFVFSGIPEGTYILMTIGEKCYPCLETDGNMGGQIILHGIETTNVRVTK